MRARILGGVAMSLAAMLWAAGAQAADAWRYALTPYVWLPSVNGKLRFDIPPGSGGSPNVESGPNDYLENMNFAMMLAGEARRGRWSLMGDLIYLNSSNEKTRTISVNLPGGGSVPVADAGTETSMTGKLITLAPGYSLLDTPGARMDVFGGVRYMAIDAKVDWRITAPVGAFPQSGAMEQDKDIVDGIVGVRGRLRLGDGRWSMPYYLDVGAGTSQLTYQASLGLSYGYAWGELALAYRHLSYDFGDEKLLDNVSFSGPAVGATFDF